MFSTWVSQRTKIIKQVKMVCVKQCSVIVMYIMFMSKNKMLQSSQVKRTPQDSKKRINYSKVESIGRQRVQL